MSSVPSGCPWGSISLASGSAFIAAPRIRFSTTTSTSTGTIDRRLVTRTGDTMMPVMLAIASMPESASTISVNPTHASAQAPRLRSRTGSSSRVW